MFPAALANFVAPAWNAIKPLAQMGSGHITKFVAPLQQKLAFATYEGGLKGALAKFAFLNVDSFAKYPAGTAALYGASHMMGKKKETPPGTNVTGAPTAAAAATPESVLGTGDIPASGNIFEGAGANGITTEQLDAQLNTFGDAPALTGGNTQMTAAEALRYTGQGIKA
jgi:hypothetical protein